MKTEKPNKYFVVGLQLVLLVLFCLSLVRSIRFVIINHAAPHWDYATHLFNALDYLMAIGQKNFGEAIFSYRFYPPLMYLGQALFFWIFGYAKTTVVITNFFLLLVLLIVIYRYTAPKLGSVAALGSAFLFLGLTATKIQPMRVNLWELGLDFPLAVAVLINYCWLRLSLEIKSFNLSRGIGLGALCAVALLIKWEAAIYLTAPALLYMVFALRRRQVLPVLSLTMTALVLAGWWYWLHARALFPELRFFAIQEGWFKGDVQGAESGIFLVRRILEASGAAILLVILLVWRGLTAVLNNRSQLSIKIKNQKSSPLLWFDIASILFPLFFFTALVANKDERYIYPLYLLIFLIVYWYLAKTFSWQAWKLITIAIVLFAFFRIFTFLPSPFRGQTSLESVSNFLLIHKPKEVAYFFEDDAPTFNYANVRLLYEELAYRKKDSLSYSYLNSHADPSSLKRCDMADKPDTVVVYSSQMIPIGWINHHTAFLETCESIFTAYELVKEIDFPQERLIFYQQLRTAIKSY